MNQQPKALSWSVLFMHSKKRVWLQSIVILLILAGLGSLCYYLIHYVVAGFRQEEQVVRYAHELEHLDAVTRASAVNSICDVIRNGHDNARALAIQALSTRGLENARKELITAVPTLIHALRQDQYAYIRKESAALLGQLGADARAAIPELIATATDEFEEASIRSEAAIAANRIDPRAAAEAGLK